MQKRYFLLDTSMIPGSWTLVTLQALLDEPRGRSKHVVGSEILNASCIMSCLRPLTQRTPFSSTLTRVLAQIRPSCRAEWLECIHQTMEAQNSLTRRCGYSLFRLAIGRGPELPGDLLQDLPNVISSSSILHDDVAAHTARIRSNARLAVMQLNDNLATRRPLDQRPRPFRRFSLGDEVAVWRRGTGKGALGKQRRAQWRGPGIILGAVRGHYFVAMPGSVIKPPTNS